MQCLMHHASVVNLRIAGTNELCLSICIWPVKYRSSTPQIFPGKTVILA